MKTLILGIGNTIRGDDGIGVYVAQELKKRVARKDFDVMITQEAGLAWLDILTGYARAVIIDSIKTDNGTIGEVYRISGDGQAPANNLYSFHQSGLATLLALGRKIGLSLPKDIIIYAIEIKCDNIFSDSLSSKIKTSMPDIVDFIESKIGYKKKE